MSSYAKDNKSSVSKSVYIEKGKPPNSNISDLLLIATVFSTFDQLLFPLIFTFVPFSCY